MSRLGPLSFSESLRRLKAASRFGVNPSLEAIRALCSAMGEPQVAFRSIQITGTNGKTSTARATASLLRANGLTTGLYTSPELERYPERIEVGGEPVTDDEFTSGVSAALTAAHEIGESFAPTEFEILTAAALWLFREREVDVAVLEVGMGGRWDATSVVTPAVAVITTVALDHTSILGDTVQAIAAEKAAIVANAGAAVVGSLPEAAERVVLEAIVGARVPVLRPCGRVLERPNGPVGLTVFDVEAAATYRELRIPAPAYQADNVALAIAAVEALAGVPLDAAQVAQAVLGMTFPGRFEVMQTDPFVIVDGSHNPQAAATLGRAIADAWPDPGGRPLVLLGVLADKDAHGIVRALQPVAGGFAVTEPDSPRALPAERLARVVEDVTGTDPEMHSDIRSAVLALDRAGDAVITGSLTTAGQARAALRAVMA